MKMEYRQHASVGVLRNDTYYKHVCAMTDEKLRDKSEISEELAVRDMRIKELEAQLATVTVERDYIAKRAESWERDSVTLSEQLATSQAREQRLLAEIERLQNDKRS